MSISINPPDPQKFMETIIQRQQGKQAQTLETLTTELNRYYRALDKAARRAFIDNAIQMYANYENKWLGEVSNGQWIDTTPQGTNNVYFTVPLLTAHVDTHTTFYTRTKPKYLAVPFNEKVKLNRDLAKMCQEIGTKELARMMPNSMLQREAQNIALATVSYRNVVMDYQPHSPTIVQTQNQIQAVPMDNHQCADCGMQFQTAQQMPAMPPMQGQEMPQMMQGQMSGMQCPNDNCMSDNTEYQGTTEEPQEVQTQTAVTLPRPKVMIPNPIAVQDDFNAATFDDTKFVITRRKISRKEAEFYYQIDLSDSYDNSDMEATAQFRQQRMPVGPNKDSADWTPLAFPDYVDVQNQQVEEVKMWLDPCEYGLYFADGSLLAQQYPDGLFLHIVGNKLVEKRPCKKDVEWIRVQQGVRPMSNKGMGMSHLADLNDAVNNSVSLEYSILRTHGFPIRLLRGRWLSALPQANQTVVMDKIPEDRDMSEAIHTEQASNTSGTLGILTGRFQSFMQYVGGSLNPTGMSPDMKDMMGSATGASAVQEMMSDRMGLSLQMRVEADINTIFAVLELLKEDPRNKQYFIDAGYDEVVVDTFFKANFRSMFYLEPVKGSDEPKLDSVNTFKIQSFAQLTAALTGLRQYDANTFYDIVSALGDTLNIDVQIGAGRKERNLADSRITRIMELYKDQKELPDALNMNAIDFGVQMFEAVTMKEKLWLQSVVQAQTTQLPPGADKKSMMMVQAEAQHIAEQIEMYLYDYDALVETYSDWLSSDLGQGADLAVQTAVGMLYGYCRGQQEKKKAALQQEAMQQALMQMGVSNPPPANTESGDTGKDGKSKVKRDGSTGPGRPMDPHVTAPSE